jgi:hypothetical protein
MHHAFAATRFLAENPAFCPALVKKTRTAFDQGRIYHCGE